MVSAVKEIKKAHSWRRVGVEMQRWVERCGDPVWFREAVEWVVSHSCEVDQKSGGILQE